MEQETINDSVWPLLLLLFFAATKLVARIFLRFICFLTCAPIFFEFLTFGFQGWDLSLDLLIWFLLRLNGGSSDLFLLVKEFSFPSDLDVEALPLVEDTLLLSLRKLRTVWIKPSKYCSTCSLDDDLWRIIATSVNFPNSLVGVVS